MRLRFTGRRLRVVRVGGAGWLAIAQGEPERAAASGLALDADLAAHQVDQPLRDRQPETGPAVLARRRAVGLPEWLKEQGLHARLDADPGVGDAERDKPRAASRAGAAQAAF